MAIWSILCITTSIMLMVVLFNRKIPLIMARTVWSPGILFISGVKIKLKGLDNIHLNDGTPKIVISNHQSFLDIPVITRVIPLNLYWTAKIEIKRMPFIGWYMMATGMIFIDRSNRERAIQSMHKAADLIKNGKDVFIFPEGRRSMDGSEVPFKKGAFYLAIESGSDIIPVHIKGTEEVWSKKSLKISPGSVSVRIGEPIASKDYTESEVDVLTKKAQSAVKGLKNSTEQPVPVS